MALLSSRCRWATTGCFFRTGVSFIWRPDGARLISQAKFYSIPGGKRQTFAVECMAAKNSKKRFIKPKKGVALESDENQSIELQANGSSSKGLLSQNSSVEETLLPVSVFVPSRGAVLQACSVTSGLLAAIGIIIRQVSHAPAEKYICKRFRSRLLEFIQTHPELMALLLLKPALSLNGAVLASSCRVSSSLLHYGMGISNCKPNERPTVNQEGRLKSPSGN